MKNVGKFVLWSILCIAVFALTAAVPAFAADVPAARLEGDAVEPEVNELPKMDFAPAQLQESETIKPVIEETAPATVREEPKPVETKSAAEAAAPADEQLTPTVKNTEKKSGDGQYVRNRKISNKVRDYWLKIHGEEGTISVPEVKKQDVTASVPAMDNVTKSNEAVTEKPAVSAVETRKEGMIIRQVPVEAKPVIEEPAPVVEEPKPAVDAMEKNAEKASAVGTRKLSDKVRECWLNIHGQEEAISVAEKKSQDLVTPEPSKAQIVRQQTTEEKADKPVVDVEKTTEETKIVVARPEPSDKQETKAGTFAPAPTVTSPPLTEAPVVFQKKSAKLALFSGPLAKMAQRREYRLAEAKRLNIVLPSQGGSFDKLPQSICKLKSTVEDILTRNGAALVLSMIFKGHFAGASTSLKRTKK